MKKVFVIILILNGCAGFSKKNVTTYSKNSPEITTSRPKLTGTTAKLLASEKGSNHVIQLRFKRGSSEINENDLKRLKNLYADSVKDSQISQVQIVTWGDKDYPKSSSSLSKDQQILVYRRNNTIKNLLKELDPKLNIIEVSMAERSSATGRFTAYEVKDIKESLEEQDVEKIPEMRSTSIIYFIPKN